VKERGYYLREKEKTRFPASESPPSGKGEGGPVLAIQDCGIGGGKEKEELLHNTKGEGRGTGVEIFSIYPKEIKGVIRRGGREGDFNLFLVGKERR